MPIDSRRLQVPADSEGYRQYINQDVKNYEARLREILNDKKLRFDGRVCDEQRKICEYLIVQSFLFLQKRTNVSPLIYWNFVDLQTWKREW